MAALVSSSSRFLEIMLLVRQWSSPGSARTGESNFKLIHVAFGRPQGICFHVCHTDLPTGPSEDMVVGFHEAG